MFRLRNVNDMRGYLAGQGGDEDVKPHDEELVEEISCRHILHWNYRRLTALPRELLGTYRQTLGGNEKHVQTTDVMWSRFT